jgi:hypothetical protein
MAKAVKILLSEKTQTIFDLVQLYMLKKREAQILKNKLTKIEKKIEVMSDDIWDEIGKHVSIGPDEVWGFGDDDVKEKEITIKKDDEKNENPINDLFNLLKRLSE